MLHAGTLADATRARPRTLAGKLADFLNKVVEAESSHKQLAKFTAIDAKLNERRFVMNEETALEAVSPEVPTYVHISHAAMCTPRDVLAAITNGLLAAVVACSCGVQQSFLGAYCDAC